MEPRFAQPGGPAEHAEEFAQVVGFAWKDSGKQELFHSAQEQRMAFGYVATTEDLLRDDQNIARGFFVGVEHPGVPAAPTPGAPFKMAETPWQSRRPAPLLGEHNAEVFGKIGYSNGDLARLREMGVI
jgi:crotonobetainyl-CoA:carnitine CoA-transferase CaiB-like acyl-CoA transferase